MSFDKSLCSPSDHIILSPKLIATSLERVQFHSPSLALSSVAFVRFAFVVKP